MAIQALWSKAGKSYQSCANSCHGQLLVNSLWPSDAIWRQRSGSTLAQVMACLPDDKFHSNFPGANELTHWGLEMLAIIKIHLFYLYRYFYQNFIWMCLSAYPGVIPWMRSANERRRYLSSLIGSAHTQNDPWSHHWWASVHSGIVAW